MANRYKLQGVCARTVDVAIDSNGVIEDVAFFGGCNGNLNAISRLVKGQSAQEIADTLKGNRCGFRDTSCADQLATALESELGRMRESGELAS